MSAKSRTSTGFLGRFSRSKKSKVAPAPYDSTPIVEYSPSPSPSPSQWFEKDAPIFDESTAKGLRKKSRFIQRTIDNTRNMTILSKEQKLQQLKELEDQLATNNALLDVKVNEESNIRKTTRRTASVAPAPMGGRKHRRSRKHRKSRK